MLKTVIIEDDRRYRESLVQLVTHTRDFELIADYGSAEAALSEAKRLTETQQAAAWDLVLIDIDLPGLNGIEATRRLRSLFAEIKLVQLTVFEDPDTIMAAICAGADGYLLKRTPPGEMLAQLRSVAADGAPLTAAVARTLLAVVRRQDQREDPVSPARLDLSERERDVLRALVDGLSYQQVGDRLAVSIDTVRSHVRGIYRKLHVHSVAEAVTRALREKLV